ncbi:hypothetical protein ACOMHN_065136 [Nucella lapillus]
MLITCSMASQLGFCFGLVVVLSVFQVGEGWGKIEILMRRFQSSCTDHGGVHQCDIYFKFCIDKQRKPNVNQCVYKKAQSGDYDDFNSMEFGSNIQGVENPLVATTYSFENSGRGDVMFTLDAWDKDFWTKDDHVETLSMNLSYTPAHSKREATWRSTSKGRGSSHMWLSYRFYCDENYYTHACNVYCKARDDFAGHYTCVEGTGKKKCMRGWTGKDCNEDINECEVRPCYHNANCTNLDGTYTCSCPQGYAGQNCDLVDTLCHSSPCQHEGNCTGTLYEYTCTCPFEWKGTNCETQVDFCSSSPCQNNSRCYATVGNYTCACARGWSGEHCTTEVNACDSSPCQNGAQCRKLPEGEYQCGCPAQYEGYNCQTAKNPCDPNPCNNSGTCNQLTYDTFNCKCVYGWVGDHCEGFLNVTAGKQQQSEGGEQEHGTNWVPIFIAILSAIIVVVGLVILLFLRRRRRQKKAEEAFLESQENHIGVVHVAGGENLSFRNAIYDQTNRANCALETVASRPPLPVPCPAPCEDAFTFTKPKVLDHDTEQGAVGGWNPYQDIDGYQAAGKYMDMEGAVGGGKDKLGDSNPRTGAAGLDTRTMAGNNQYDDPQGPATNPYADFEDLKRRSVAVREASGYANSPDSVEQLEEVEENHYHDLDDLFLDIQTSDPHPLTSDPDPRPAHPSTASHYDSPRSLSSDFTSAGYDVPPRGHDLPSPRQAAGGGYMPMEGSALPEDPLKSLDSSSEEEEGANQEDIEKLRQEVLQNANSQNGD